jgi:serine/threonine protein kinase
MAPEMGEAFGKYELIEKVATGGMAEVFLAKQTGDLGGFSKKVAIKRMFSYMADSPEATNMFLDEGRIAASFNHPNIVQIYDLGREGENLYLAMEYVHGRDLKRVFDRGRAVDSPLPLSMAAHIVSQVASGLHYAHERLDERGQPMNVVHRDVSPQNVLVSDQGHVKVCDFGIAKAEDRLQHTKQGQFKGKIAYMSPEQFETSNLDRRSDIYSLGVLLYEATTGHRVYDADTDLEIVRLMSIGDIRQPSELVTGYPEELEAIVLKCINKDQAKRYATAEELHIAVEEWLDKTSSRPSAMHIGRYMKALFPELSGEEAAEDSFDHEDKTMIIEPLSSATAEMLNVDQYVRSSIQDENVVVADQSNWDEDESDQTVMIVGSNDQTAEMDVFQRDRLKEASEPVVPNLDLPVFAPTPVASTPVASTPVASTPVASTPVASTPVASTPVASTPVTPTPLAVPKLAAAPATDPGPYSDPIPPATAEPAPTVIGSVPPRTLAPPPNIRGSVPPNTAAPGPRPAAKRTDPAPRAAAEEADVSLDDFVLSRRKSSFLIPVGFVLLFAIAALVFYIQVNQESDLEKQAVATNIDPKLLDDDSVPPPPTVAVAFVSDPPGASFIVNGLPALNDGGGLTLREGRPNQVVALLDGFVSASLTVEGKAATNPYTIKLDQPVPTGNGARTASLAVVSEPRDATVWLDGREVGRTPMTLNDLSADVEHYVYLTKDDFFGYAGFIGLVPGAENEVQVEFARKDSARRNYVEVVYAAIPRMTAVNIDGEPSGATPMRKNHERGSLVEVDLDEADHAPQSYVLEMAEVGTLEIRPFLKEMKREKGFVSLSIEPAGGTLYVGANGFGTEPVIKLELKEGKYPVVVEHLGERLRGTIAVLPKEHVVYVLAVENGAITARRSN